MSGNEQCPVCAQLQAAALHIVGEQGLDALSAERLAGRAGVGVEEVRSHYPDLNRCLYDTYERVALSIYQDIAAALRDEPDWADALRSVRDALLARLAARPYEARLCFIEILRGDHELLRRRDASRRRLIRLFVRELGRRQPRAEGCSMQLELLIGAVFQAIAAAVGERGTEQLPELGAELESRALVFAPVAA